MTIMYLYYNQPEAIAFLESIGCPEYPIDFLFVDDGSKEPLKLDWPNAKVVRIDKDIPWNMSAANNMGFRHLSGKVLRLDIDHYIERVQVDQLKWISPNRMELVIFSRYRPDINRPIDPAPNIYLIDTEDFWSVGGYDEDYCGHYGYEDKDIRRKFDRAGFSVRHSPLMISVNTRFSTKGLDRDLTTNKKLYLWKGTNQ